MSTMLLEELVGRLRVAVECCGRVEEVADGVERLLLTTSSGRRIGVINATARSARATAPTSTAAARKALTSTMSRHSYRFGVWGCRGLGGDC
jgi:hypothetical protein